jgi:hypothetical protein
MDGTGTISFDHPHCPHCLTRTRNGKTIYYHPVLEAKLLTSNGFAFSLMTEFIGNPAQRVTKQDCELKAFYRLAERLKIHFPRCRSSYRWTVCSQEGPPLICAAVTAGSS